ncbi:MAG: hypothetical protein QOH39_2447 [Verrucomicrobiota bacterium]|jgi:hypothetical protein
MSSQTARGRARRVGLVFLGIFAGQLILYGASFVGTKILLPLDILTVPGNYIPLQPGQNAQQPHNEYMSDAVFEDEPARLFRHNELRAGRLPLWNPYQYAGTPNISFLSPFALFGALIRSPRILPWVSLAVALVSGFGAYTFARRVLEVGLWPAAIGAWCYPLTGFFVFWQSYSLAYPAAWLPWMLWAVHVTLTRSNRWALPALALVTALTILSGHLDIAALVLIAGGLFAIWDFSFLFHGRIFDKQSIGRFATVIAGWALGFMLGSPELLPALEYTKTGSRLSARGGGQEERPPVGLVSLPQFVLPHIYGTIERGSFPIVPKNEANLAETPAAGFAGLIMTLAIAPLAWASRRHRAVAGFFAALTFLGLAWCLNVPGLVALMRLPGFNMLPYNRFVFASSFAILSLAVIGFETILSTTVRWRASYYIPLAILVVIAGWSSFRALSLPEAIAVTLPDAVTTAPPVRWITDMEAVHRVQHWFVKMYLAGMLVCLVALTAWIGLRLTGRFPRIVALLAGLAAIGELLFFDYGRAAQCDPKLYYPPIAALEKVGGSWPGRAIGFKCLPANLLQTRGLPDVRGYDGVDPARLVDLLDLARQPGSIRLNYAAAQYFEPRAEEGLFPDSVRLPPILDLLGVRYLVCLTPDATGYFVLTNHSALPRVFAPLSVKAELDEKKRLAKLGAATFGPRDVAYVEELDDSIVAGRGETTIVQEDPRQITVNARMTRGGLIVLADQWNKGWRAHLGDKAIPILRVDHALRGVIAPTGESTIVFRYEPGSFRLGAGVAVIAVLIVIIDFLLRRPTDFTGRNRRDDVTKAQAM